MVINVMLVDDQKLMRDGLKVLLEYEGDFVVVAEANNGEEAVDLYRINMPDVVLMDIEMPKMNGIDAIRSINLIDPNARILVLTTFGQERYVHDSLIEGARGFLLKAVSGEELAANIRKVVKGESVLDAQSTELLLKSYRKISAARYLNEKQLLNDREKQILELIAENRSNQDIATKLHLAEGTVKNYVSQILEKLQVCSRGQAVTSAREKGLI
ncbi:LuxR family two component transcriptional regulator [Marinimicrobium koreense]|uniref:LuxR family two component transcriptional regulator n=1 Tax=Marinimicrobium koreense TaxID=306545 RepID=A0A3N1P417_9GAMM|nr:response regulator transcription factor [Marinimicrobium koreense]ROQ19586.1 LuxR family two component transcriptional regulator [Marinimicrobium koreense]